MPCHSEYSCLRFSFLKHLLNLAIVFDIVVLRLKAKPNQRLELLPVLEDCMHTYDMCMINTTLLLVCECNESIPKLFVVINSIMIRLGQQILRGI